MQSPKPRNIEEKMQYSKSIMLLSIAFALSLLTVSSNVSARQLAESDNGVNGDHDHGHGGGYRHHPPEEDEKVMKPNGFEHGEHGHDDHGRGHFPPKEEAKVATPNDSERGHGEGFGCGEGFGRGEGFGNGDGSGHGGFPPKDEQTVKKTDDFEHFRGGFGHEGGFRGHYPPNEDNKVSQTNSFGHGSGDGGFGHGEGSYMEKDLVMKAARIVTSCPRINENKS